MKREPNYTPRSCHRCSGAGCDRCAESGFTVGPDSTPVPVGQLSAPQLNWHDLMRRKS